MTEKMTSVSLMGRRRLEAFSDNMSAQHSCPPTQAAVFQPLIAGLETVKQRQDLNEHKLRWLQYTSKPDFCLFPRVHTSQLCTAVTES